MNNFIIKLKFYQSYYSFLKQKLNTKGMMKLKESYNKEKFDKFNLKNVAVASECTGLIKQIPLTPEEEDAYHEIFDYGPG